MNKNNSHFIAFNFFNTAVLFFFKQILHCSTNQFTFWFSNEKEYRRASFPAESIRRALKRIPQISNLSFLNSTMHSLDIIFTCCFCMTSGVKTGQTRFFEQVFLFSEFWRHRSVVLFCSMPYTPQMSSFKPKRYLWKRYLIDEKLSMLSKLRRRINFLQAASDCMTLYHNGGPKSLFVGHDTPWYVCNRIFYETCCKKYKMGPTAYRIALKEYVADIDRRRENKYKLRRLYQCKWRIRQKIATLCFDLLTGKFCLHFPCT